VHCRVWGNPRAFGFPEDAMMQLIAGLTAVLEAKETHDIAA
jgi:hypothetical protein